MSRLLVQHLRRGLQHIVERAREASMRCQRISSLRTITAQELPQPAMPAPCSVKPTVLPSTTHLIPAAPP